MVQALCCWDAKGSAGCYKLYRSTRHSHTRHPPLHTLKASLARPMGEYNFINKPKSLSVLLKGSRPALFATLPGHYYLGEAGKAARYTDYNSRWHSKRGSTRSPSTSPMLFRLAAYLLHHAAPQADSTSSSS